MNLLDSRTLRPILTVIVASVIAASVFGAAVVAAAVAHTAAQVREPWVWPLNPQPTVVRVFEPPLGPYGPGHRGADLAGRVGQAVLAVDDGRVSFAGKVAGRGVVVVDHGRLRSTYEPVLVAVGRGDRVDAGQLVGTLTLAGGHCLPSACLHLGARTGDVYVDPLRYLSVGPVRLLPLDGWAAGPAATRGPVALPRLGLGAWMSQRVGGPQPLGAHMGIDLGGRQRLVAEQFLHRPQVGTTFQQVRGGTVP